VTADLFVGTYNAISEWGFLANSTTKAEGSNAKQLLDTCMDGIRRGT
jgi:hypothetical protein